MTEPAPAPDLAAGRSRRAVVRFLLIAVVFLAADLGLKAWSHGSLDAFETVIVVPKILGLRLVENHGAVFGIGQGMRWGFVAFTFLALGVVGYLFATSRARETWLHLALALICAGAVGNLYDRVFHGHVRDMLYLFPDVNLPFGLTWAWLGSDSREAYPWIFNAADAFLLVGIGFIFIRSFIVPDPRKPADAKSDPAPSADSR